MKGMWVVAGLLFLTVAVHVAPLGRLDRANPVSSASEVGVDREAAEFAAMVALFPGRGQAN
jgi:hypothetical protein